MSRPPNGEDVTLEERTLVTNAIQEDGDGQKRSSTVTRTYLKPTTMRGIPLAKLTPSSQGTMRGFYVTRSENDLATASTMPMPANDFTIPHVTTYRSERQRTETTFIPDISTTDDIVTVASESGQHEAVRSDMPNNHANSIVNDEVIDNLKEDSPSSSEALPSEDSDSAENLSDHREIDIVTTLARSASKRGKSLDKSDDEAALSRNAHVISMSTTPTRRKIALVVSRYNEATTPLWTGKRIVTRKRNRNTLSSIKQAMRRTKSEQTTANVFKNAFATFLSSSTSTTPAIASDSTVEASEALNTHRKLANFTDKAAEDSEKRTATEATIDATEPIMTFSSFPQSTANDATAVIVSTILTAPPTIMTTSLIAAAKTSAATTDAVLPITTTPSVTTRIETASEIANYSAITVPIIAQLNSNEFATTTTPIATHQIEDTEIDGVSTIANYKLITMNSMTVNDPHKFTTVSAHESTLETTNAAVATAYTTENYSTLAVPLETLITNARAATTIPAIQTSSLIPTVTSTTNLRVNTIAPATTHDIVDTNTDVDATRLNATSTPTTVIGPTTIDTNVTVTVRFASANANLSLAVTSATADTTVPDLINSATWKPSVNTDTTLASLTVADQVSSTESSTISSITSDLSGMFDTGGKDLDKLPVSATAVSIGSTELTTMFETSPTLTISPSLSHLTIDPETSTTVTMVTSAFPIQTDDSLVTSMEAQTLPSFFSNAKIATVDATTYRSSITSSILDSAQTTDKEAVLSEMNIERDLKEDVIAAITQDQTVNRKTTNINEKSSLQTTNEERSTLPETKATSNESASKNAENRGGNQTASQLDTNDYVLRGQKASRRRVLNRTNNWIGSPVTQHSTNHYPRRRVTIYRHRESPPRPSDYISSSRVIEGNLRRRNMQKRLRINSEAISSTVRPENISEQHTVHDSTKNVTRRMKVVLKRIKEKITEENATVSPVQETTAFVRSSTYTETENTTLQARRKNSGRRRRVVLKRFKPPQSGENSTSEEIGAYSDFADENLSNKSPRNLRVGEARAEENNTRRRMRLVLKSIRAKSEEKNMTEQTSADSDQADKTFRNNRTNNFYVNDNLSPQEADARKRTRVVWKSVRPKSKERNVTVEEANTNFRFHSTNARSTQEDPPRNFRTGENIGTEGKTRRRMRVVLRRVKPKFKEQKTVEFGRVNENTTDESLESASWSNHREGKELSYQYRTRRGRRKVEVLKSTESKSERDSTEETSEHLFDEEGTKEQMRIAVDSVKPRFAEKDSIAEETNMDLDFAVKVPRITLPFNFSNNFPVSEKIIFVNELSNVEEARKGVEFNYKNEGTTIERSKGFDAKLPTESVAQVEQDTDRPSLEVNSSNNGGSVSRKTGGNGYPNRHRKPPQSTTTVASPTNGIPPNTHRRGTSIETTVSPNIRLVDVFENTESYAKQNAEDDQKTDPMSDQSIRAQEFAVTVADPPSSSLDTGRTPLRDAVRRKISTTVAPRTYPTTGRTKYDAGLRDRQRPRTKNRPTVNATTRPRRPPVIDYDYYEDEVPIVIGKSALNSKLFLTSKGTIRCLDQGNFPHPYSCKRFITCARMVNGQVIGTEYTCPDKLSFDPVGGICNWSAGLGCKD